MPSSDLNADYLIVGAGAMGMAFADTLLSETENTMIIVDDQHKPGGHWNHAYPFVALHQPSSFYGVASSELSSGRFDTAGFNKGLGELASGPQICAYYDDLMRCRFIPSGRVQYFPLCDYQGEGKFVHRLTGKTYTATAPTHVDGTFFKSNVPATHVPNFTIDDGVQFIPLGKLPDIQSPPDGFVVIGGGKTGIDACLWLLEHGVAPDDIRWIMPRDAWLLDRKNTQTSADFFNETMGAQAGQFESIANARNMEHMFDLLEECGYFARIEKNIRPKMFHGATISQAELAAVRQIKNIIRLGRISHIGRDEIKIGETVIPTSPGHIHIDCSASAATNREIVPVFDENIITLQTIRSYQPVFSASMIAYVQANYDDPKEKNRLCNVVPLPDTLNDYVRMTAAFMVNQANWGGDKTLRAWIANNRLDGFSKMVMGLDKADSEKRDILKRLKASSIPAMFKLQQFIAEIGDAP